MPEHLKDVPFAPFSKGDKIGRAADWTASAYQKYPGETRDTAVMGCRHLVACAIFAAATLLKPAAQLTCFPDAYRQTGRYNQNQSAVPAVFNFFANDEVCLNGLSERRAA